MTNPETPVENLFETVLDNPLEIITNPETLVENLFERVLDKPPRNYHKEIYYQ
jgi:hypothetical protein